MSRITRHQERVWALQVLYSLDLAGEIDVDHANRQIKNIKKSESLKEEDYYFEELVQGVIKDQNHFDSIINSKAIDWDLKRMAYIDRNILRIAVYEIENELPRGVAINEAVELAKEYGDSKSAGFINGILAGIEHINNT